VQSEYSLWTRDPEAEVLPTLRELGIGLVAYSPLGRGFLTGQIRSVDDLPEDDWRRSNPRFQDEALRQNIALADRVRALAEEHGVTRAQLALAWVHAKGDDIVPIPGTKRPRRLEENVGATQIELSDEDVATLDHAVPAGAVVGGRYRDAEMALISS
jgi:aryl-alcohol dehydrogenase-like predicted oxidoreductase